MRLATIATASGPRAALLHGDCYVDLHATNSQLSTTVRGLLEGGPSALRAAEEAAARSAAVCYPMSAVKLLAPIPDPPKIVCVGLNYRDHAAESGAPIPREPVLFSKFATAIIGPEVPIVLPKVSTKVDYEAELVLVVGKRGRHLTKETRARLSCRVHGRPRRFGPRLAAGKGRQAVVGRQDVRHLRPHRPASRHQGRGAGRHGARHPPASQRHDDAG